MQDHGEKLRVALFRNNFLPYSETFIHDEIRHHERYDVTVFARQHRNAERFPGNAVCSVEAVPGKRRRLASMWYGLTTRSGILERSISQGGFHLVHAHHGHNGVYAMGFARRHRLPLVVSLHGKDVTILLGRDMYRPVWWNYSLRYRRLIEETALFLAASRELKDLFVGIGCPEEKVVVHRLGVDITSLQPGDSKSKDSPATVVMVGRFVEKKGHEYGIRAAGIALGGGRRFRLVVIGDGPLRSRYVELAQKVGVSEILELPGALRHSEVADALKSATVLMAPSVVGRNLDRESGLIVAKEASACGVPVVGTRHGGIPDIVEDGVTGYLVEERDADSLGKRLSELLDDENLRKSMGSAARLKMEREYDIRERTRALEEIYDSVIADR